MQDNYGRAPRKGFFESTSSYRSRVRQHYDRRNKARTAQQATQARQTTIADLEKRLKNQQKLNFVVTQRWQEARKISKKNRDAWRKVSEELTRVSKANKKLTSDVRNGKRSISNSKKANASQKRKIANLKRQLTQHKRQNDRDNRLLQSLRNQIRKLKREVSTANRRQRQITRQPRQPVKDYRPLPYYPEEDYYEEESAFPLMDYPEEFVGQLPAGWEGTAMPYQSWDSGQNWYPNNTLVM